VNLFDKKFLKNKRIYTAQCLLATAAVFLVLLMLDIASNAAIIASLGASAFIAFTMPHAHVSAPRFLIGGYLAGIGSGWICYRLMALNTLVPGAYETIIFSALAVGLSIFVMVITDTEHPPASGLALGLVLNQCQARSIAVILVGIILLSLVKKLLSPVLKDLL